MTQVGHQVEAWTWELARWVDRVAPVFARPEPRELLQQMTVGLLSPLPKKNGWTLAEQAGHTHPGRIQTFLCRGAWDAAALEGQVRDMVVEALGDSEGGVLIVDDTHCAMRCSVISLAEWGEIGGISLDLMADLEPKGVTGTRACQETIDQAQAYGVMR